MFDGNRDINVGRDININSHNDYSTWTDEELNQKKMDCHSIKNKESKKKFKRSINLLIFISVLFVAIYFSVPYLLDYLIQNSTGFINKMIPREIDPKLQLTLMVSLSLLAILRPITDIWSTTKIEKKQNEILSEINVILKERNYLKKK